METGAWMKQSSSGGSMLTYSIVLGELYCTSKKKKNELKWQPSPKGKLTSVVNFNSISAPLRSNLL